MEQNIQEMAEAYKLLADKTRLTIIALLQEQELCVCDITDIIGMSQPNASQHLRKLKAAGLLNEKKKGSGCTTLLIQMQKPMFSVCIPICHP